MADTWLDVAKTAVQADASVALYMCQQTAVEQKVNLWWVVEEFKKEFERIAKNDG